MKKQKLYEKIMGKPPSKNIRWREVESFFSQFGYEKVEGAGSRVSFYNHDLGVQIDLHKPHGGKNLLVYQVKEIQSHIIEAGL